eukprot:11079058-Ditylum_brightwellii.AAC.1
MAISKSGRNNHRDQAYHAKYKDNGEEAIEYIPSASKDGEQLGPNNIPLEDPMYRYQTRSQTYQMNLVATLKNYSSKELMDTHGRYWQEKEKKDYHVVCAVTD